MPREASRQGKPRACKRQQLCASILAVEEGRAALLNVWLTWPNSKVCYIVALTQGPTVCPRM